MGVYISNMEMPKGCASCPFYDDECFGAYKCDAVQSWGSDTERASGCPLIHVPPHGRLIDADEFCTEHRSLKMLRKVGLRRFNWHIAAAAFVDDAPAIIPASEEG